LSNAGAPGNGGAAVMAPDQGRPRFSSGQPGGSRPPRFDGPGRGERRHSPPPFRPTHEVLFYPDDAAFRALLKAIRTSCRTYELFEVAHLILQKPERFVVVIKAYPHSDGVTPRVHVAQPDHLPFETEEEAVAHVFDKHLDKFCTVEEVEVEPPKGNFVGVSKCGFTGELIGPPNYHRYPELLREHHSRKLARVPFDKFSSRLELVKEPEQISAWLEKMKKATRYKLKTPIEGAPEFFESLDAARAFLLSKSKDAIVRDMETARYSGRLLEQFPPGNIRHSIEAVLEQQRRFPLDTANNLRGRLRRMKFNLYKRGSKGVSFICAVKRRFRDPQTVLADHVQKLITFVEQHPNILASKLPHEFLGLPPPVDAKSAAPAAPAAEAPAVTESAPAAPEAANAPAPEFAPKAEAPSAKPETQFTPEQQLQLRELVINLRWLVTEGYVVEYGDGRLFAPPPLPAPKPKTAEGTPAVEGEAVHSEDELIEETPPPFPLPGEEEPADVMDDAEVAEFSDVLIQPVEKPTEAPTEPPPAGAN